MRHMAARGGNSGDRRLAPTNETPECAQGKSVISPPMVGFQPRPSHPSHVYPPRDNLYRRPPAGASEMQRGAGQFYVPEFGDIQRQGSLSMT